MRTLLALLVGSVVGLNRIEIVGSKLFDSVTGEQFYAKGIAYQPGGEANQDALSQPENCRRDAKYLKELGVNVVRVYGAMPDKNHDVCMEELKSNGIYIMLDLAVPKVSINRKEPRYNLDILKHFQGNVDAFSKYDNVLGFIAGNEVTNDKETTEASAHIKALLRDTKAYIKEKGLKIPVGYVDNDDPDIRKNIQDYFNCGDESERADFYGINIYSWCGESTFQKSQYKDRTDELKDYSIPVFLAEYGCNEVSPRPFTEILSLYGKDMQDVFSGGFAYEFTQESNKYGLVEVKGKSLTKLKDFENVKKLLNQVNPDKIKKKDYSPKSKPRDCPAVGDKWKANSKLPPSPSEEGCKCALESLKCRVNKAGADKENGKTVGEQLGYICKDDTCSDVALDVTKGTYGRFATCSPNTVNSIIFNAAVTKGATCAFDGMAEVASPTQSDIDKCAAMLPKVSSTKNQSPSLWSLGLPQLSLLLASYYLSSY